MANRIGKVAPWNDAIEVAEAEGVLGGRALTHAGEYAVDGDVLFGVTEYAEELEGRPVNCIRQGTCPVTVDDDSAAIAVGDKLGVSDAGLWEKRTTGNYHGIARSTTTGGTGEEVDMDLISLAPLVIPEP